MERHEDYDREIASFLKETDRNLPAALGRLIAARAMDGAILGIVAIDRAGTGLQDVFVHPDRRGQGIGTELVLTALADLRQGGAKEVLAPAHAFLERFGFTVACASPEGTTETTGVVSVAAGPPLLVRGARPDDAAEIADVYNEGIADRIATLETELRTPEERRRWLQERPPRFCVLVAAADAAQNVLGWLSLNPFSARVAYRFVADISIYVARGARGRGVGRRLLAAGLREARRCDFHKLVLTMFPENVAAKRLYREFGFETVGVLHQQGLLDGVWRDTEMMERLLENGERH